MDYATLKAELQDARYSGMTDAEAATDLNEKRITELRERYVDERAVIALFGPDQAIAVLEAFEGKGNASGNANAKVLHRAKGWMSPSEGGVNMGDPTTRGMIDLMVADNDITAEQAAKLKAEGERTISRAEQFGLGPVYEGHVYKARNQ